MKKTSFIIIIFTITFFAFGYSNHANIVCKQESNILEKATTYGGNRSFYLSDYFDLVEFAFVVDDYAIAKPGSKYPEQVYSLTPTLKLRPNNFSGIFTKKRFIPEEIKGISPLMLEVKLLSIEGGNDCKSCNTDYRDVRINVYDMPSTTFEPEIRLNPMAEVGDDGTIKISATDPIGYVKFLEDIENSKGMYIDIRVKNGSFNSNSLYKNIYVSSPTYYKIFGWEKHKSSSKTKPEMAIPDSICKFIIKSTNRIQKENEEFQKAKEEIQKANALSWIDMGIRDENGNIIYWSRTDFAIYKTGSVGFVEYGDDGSTFGWGDISGLKTGANLSQYGGQNPPKRIDGNAKYDIVTAKLGPQYRLPTQKEMQALIDNCYIEKTTINRGPLQGTNGLPSWVQGQWMINDAVLTRGATKDGVINYSISIRVAGGFASYYKSPGNNYWEGPYHYADGKITIGNLTLIVDNKNKILKDNSNNTFRKISGTTVNDEVTGILFTSKINGHSLLFAMPEEVSNYNSGNVHVVFSNEQKIDYWTGSLCESCNGSNEFAVFMRLASDGYGMVAEPRSYHKRIRAVKVGD